MNLSLVSFFFLCSWFRVSWINVNNCPRRCDLYRVLLYLCRQLYIFRLIPLSIIRSTLKTVITTPGSGRTVLLLSADVPTPPRQRTVANTDRPVPDVVITVWVCSWWWMRVSSETCRVVCRNIIKLYTVASFWTIIDTLVCFSAFCIKTIFYLPLERLTKFLPHTSTSI